jgi:hypothetical protein
MDEKIKKFKKFPFSPEYINSLRDINIYKEQYLGVFQQEFPVSTFIDRLTDAVEEKDNANRGRRDKSMISVRIEDLDEILRQFTYIDNALRKIHIDVDLRSEPTVINIPDGLDKEEFIKNNSQILF